MKRNCLFALLAPLMIGLLACQCTLPETLLEGIGLPSAQPTATVWPTKEPQSTPQAERRPDFPAVSLDELDLPLVVTNQLSIPRSAEPVTSGVPIPRELGLTSVTGLQLLGPDGDVVPAQFTPLARWGAGPEDEGAAIRWLLVDFQADVTASGEAVYRLQEAGAVEPSFPMLSVTETGDALSVDTGTAVFVISREDGSLSGTDLSSPVHSVVREPGGAEYVSRAPVELSVRLSGPMRVSIEVKGTYREGLQHTSRYWFYAGQAAVRVFHTVENNTLCPLDPNGQPLCYEIDSPGSIRFADCRPMSS